MYKNSVLLLGALCWSLLAALFASVPANAQATVTFSNASVTIDQGTSSVDFFGLIDNSAGTSAIAPALEQSSTSSGTDLSPFITYYDSFGPQNNLPSSVAAGAVTSQIDFFSVDTSSLPLGTYSGSMTLNDSNSSSLTAPANFSITVAAAPEPSACAALAVGAIGLGVLILRARRKPTA